MVKPIHLAVGLLLAVPALRAQTPTWTIADRPLVSIGGDNADTLILRAGSALRLANGTIVIGSNRNSQLQFFDAAGRHVKTAGRRGQGPQEFGGNVYVYVGNGDTIVAHDERNRRYHYLTPAGEFVRLDTLGDIRRKTWMYDRTILARTPGNADIAQLRQTIARIPFAPRDTVRVGYVDHASNIWLRDAANARLYAVYARDGRMLGSVTIPPKFTPYQILDTLVIGLWTDADDVEHIQVRALTRARASSAPPAAARATYDQDAELAANRNLVGQMSQGLRRIGTAQEAYYADNQRYSPNLEPILARVPVAPGIKVTIFAATANGYGVIAEHATLKVVCVLALFAGNLPGEWVVCG